MSTILWIVQIILGIKLLTVSYTHGLRQSQPTMQDAMAHFGGFAQLLLYAVAIIAFAGAMGLILPGFLGFSPWVTGATAAIMSFMLLFSIFLHSRSREKPKIFVSLVLFAFALFTAYGRAIYTP